MSPDEDDDFEDFPEDDEDIEESDDEEAVASDDDSTSGEDGEEPVRPMRPEEVTQMPAGFRSRRGVESSEGGFVRVRLPDKKLGELFGVADQLMGGSRLKVMCEDGASRLCRIPGKMKRRMWIREGDLVIVKPWDFQDEKADVVWRYTKTQAQYLARRGLVPKQIDIYTE